MRDLFQRVSNRLLAIRYRSISYNDALVQAAGFGDINAVRKFVACGADINYEHGTPLFEACAEGQTETARVMIDEYNADVNTGNPSLYAAAMRGKVETAKMLKERGAIDERGYAFEVAAREGQVEMLKFLFDGDSNVNKDRALCAAAEKGQVEAVKLLLGYGADVNAKRNVNGGTAAEIAAEAEQVAVLGLLLERGAKISGYSLAGSSRKTKKLVSAFQKAAALNPNP